MALNVFPAGSVYEFDSEGFEGMLFIDSGKTPVTQPDSIRALVAKFIAGFGCSGVVCFESTLDSNGSVQWRRFRCDQR